MLWINIARITWLELWQSRTYKILLLIALFAPISAIIVASLFMVDIGKVYVDGISAISQLLAMVFLIFLAVSLLSRDIFGRVCYVLLTPPVSRTDYFLGRFIGISFVFFVLLMVFIFAAFLGGILYVEVKGEFYQSGYSGLMLAQLIFFNFFQYISILGVIFFIVSWSSGDAETMLFTISMLIFTWVFPPVLKAIQNPDVAAGTPLAIMTMLQWIYEALPHLQGADISLRLAHGISIGATEASLYVLEHSLYAVAFFVLGLIIFKRRDL